MSKNPLFRLSDRSAWAGARRPYWFSRARFIVWTPIDRRLLVFLILIAGSVCLRASAQVIEAPRKQVVIKHARATYYNIRERGFVESESNILPNWKAIVGDLDQPTLARVLSLLNGIKFTIIVNAEGKTNITHKAEIAAQTDKMQKSFDEIFTGMEEMLTGFWQTEGVFMLSSPLPSPESIYKLEGFSGGYRVTYDHANTNIVTTMSKTR